MGRYILYNDDTRVARFEARRAVVEAFTPEKTELLPMQIRRASAEGFAAWVRERAVDLSSVQHRALMYGLYGTRDKLTLALKTHMFSLSDTFTCFEEGQFVPRLDLCCPDDQNAVSDFILISGDTSLRQLRVVTPNASTDGSFTKTWRYADGAWWLYKLQPAAATEAEVQISRALRALGWDAAEYTYVGRYRTRVRTRCFLNPHEVFEPYDSYRFAFDDPGDQDEAVARNLAAAGCGGAWKRILLADAVFLNADRHMRNFGVIRSTATGEVLRLAPNFDNNQAYLANPGGRYSDGMLRRYMRTADAEDWQNLRALGETLAAFPYLNQAYQACQAVLDGR